MVNLILTKLLTLSRPILVLFSSFNSNLTSETSHLLQFFINNEMLHPFGRVPSIWLSMRSFQKAGTHVTRHTGPVCCWKIASLLHHQHELSLYSSAVGHPGSTRSEQWLNPWLKRPKTHRYFFLKFFFFMIYFVSNSCGMTYKSIHYGIFIVLCPQI